MKVFLPDARERASHNLFVTPANDPDGRNVSDWVRDDGVPIMQTVTFKFGVAKVDPRLGRYLIDKGLAQASPLILPT